MLQPQKFELKTKYEGSSQRNHIRVLRPISVQISTPTSSVIQLGKKWILNISK